MGARLHAKSAASAIEDTLYLGGDAISVCAVLPVKGQQVVIFLTVQNVVQAADYVIMDLKLADPLLHKRYTGVENGRILENAALLRSSGKPHEFRTPRIPGITDTEENLAALREIAGDSPYELLPYNELAGAKYPMLGMEFPYDTLAAAEEKKNV